MRRHTTHLIFAIILAFVATDAEDRRSLGANSVYPFKSGVVWIVVGLVTGAAVGGNCETWWSASKRVAERHVERWTGEMGEAGVECYKTKALFSEAFKKIQVRETEKSIMWKQAKIGERKSRSLEMEECKRRETDGWAVSIKEQARIARDQGRCRGKSVERWGRDGMTANAKCNKKNSSDWI